MREVVVVPIAILATSLIDILERNGRMNHFLHSGKGTMSPEQTDQIFKHQVSYVTEDLQLGSFFQFHNNCATIRKFKCLFDH